MRLHRVLLALLVLGGISCAQDTNFPVGPQYLATTGNPMLLRPIATPSLSLSGGGLAGTSEVPTPAESPAFAPLETIVYLDNVYWGAHKPAEVVARRVETPIMSPDQTAWYMNFVTSQLTSPPPLPSPESSESAAGSGVIELTGSPMPNNLPASILDVGAIGKANPLVLQERGVSLGDVAAYWKSHRRTAARAFTNSDVTRLRGQS
ncbi:MAG: hypothetical protein LAP86_19590 [Acidobacteriia bacterium]|nr:hypothetical protein [Terriglobia bacterium]